MQELRLERARQPNSGTGQRVERRIPYPETDDGGAAAVRSWWSENGWSLAQQATRITTKATTTQQDKNNNYRADVSDRLEMFIHVKLH